MIGGIEPSWLGKCRDESYTTKREFVEYCTACGKPMYDDEEFYDCADGFVCEKCYENRQRNEEEGGEDDEY